MISRTRNSFVVGIAALVSMQMTFGYGQTFNTVINNGPASNRVDVIFIGDGYTADQIETVYADHVDQGITHFFGGNQDPFRRYQNFFNVHRVNVISNESGADQPPLGIFRDTALDASYWANGTTERLLNVNRVKASLAAIQAVSGTGIDIDMPIAIVNDTKYGGAGGLWSVYAGGNSSSTEIALHEVGHSFASLADEYESGKGLYSGPEPTQANATVTAGTPLSPGKWDRWVGYVDPDNPQIGPVSYYEGGFEYEEGIYRPTFDSKMRSLHEPFNAISRESIISRIYELVTPLDGFLDNSMSLLDPESVWVDAVDPDVINVSWLLDGVLLAHEGELIDLASLQLAPGDYELEARAYDGILDDSFTGRSLDWWRIPDTSPLRQSVNWNFSISAVPEPSGTLLILVLAATALPHRRGRKTS